MDYICFGFATTQLIWGCWPCGSNVVTLMSWHTHLLGHQLLLFRWCISYHYHHRHHYRRYHHYYRIVPLTVSSEKDWPLVTWEVLHLVPSSEPEYTHGAPHPEHTGFLLLNQCCRSRYYLKGYIENWIWLSIYNMTKLKRFSTNKCPLNWVLYVKLMSERSL